MTFISLLSHALILVGMLLTAPTAEAQFGYSVFDVYQIPQHELPSSLNQDTITIPQHANKSTTFTRIDSLSDGENVFVGETGLGDYVHLIKVTGPRIGKAFLVGNVVSVENATVYQYRSFAGADNVLVTAKPSTSFLEEGSTTTSQPEVRRLGSSRLPKYNPVNSNNNRHLQGTSFIDILVPWTYAAECKESQLPFYCELTDETHDRMHALVELAISETNVGFANSGILVTVRLAHSYRLNFDEIQYMSAGLLNALSKGAEGAYGVQTVRAQYRADMVQMVADLNDSCGNAYVNLDSSNLKEDILFSVVDSNCVTGVYTFGHNIALNLGCQHDRGSLDKCGTDEPLAYGYRSKVVARRDVLAQNCSPDQCDGNPYHTCARINYYSTPFFPTDEHGPLGDAYNYCSRTIAQSAYYVSQVYDDTATVPPTKSPTISPTKSPTVSPTKSPTALPTKVPTATPTSSSSTSPSSSPSEIPTVAPTVPPTSTPSIPPLLSPSVRPTASPSEVPTSSPSVLPTTSPSTLPTTTPSALPTLSPSVSPTNSPLEPPTSSPSALPTSSPSALPTSSPSALPTTMPSTLPKTMSSTLPTTMPSALPTTMPSALPTTMPSTLPTTMPSALSTPSPSTLPTTPPSVSPTVSPTVTPTASPSVLPTLSPTKQPTLSPTTTPSKLPTQSPTFMPTKSPTVTPRKIPTFTPTKSPTFTPTKEPTSTPTKEPTYLPTKSPTVTPTKSPTFVPTPYQPICGNGICEATETCDSCPSDCPTVSIISTADTCGNGICEAGNGEDYFSCSLDCRGKDKSFACGVDGDCSHKLCNNGRYQCTNVPVTQQACCGGDCSGVDCPPSCNI